MAEIIIAGEIYIDPDKRAGCLEAGLPHQAATRREEPGCLAYVFAADPVEPGTMVVYERWADAASLEAHFLHPNYHAMLQLLMGAGLESAVSHKMRIDARAPVYGPGGKPTASFG